MGKVPSRVNWPSPCHPVIRMLRCRAPLIVGGLLMLSVLLGPVEGPGAPARPISLHPENGRYFLFRDKPAVLITSGEHYGAVLNLDFDYVPYLDELRARGLNQTRTFAGTYREISGSFKIENNTLAPAPDRF